MKSSCIPTCATLTLTPFTRSGRKASVVDPTITIKKSKTPWLQPKPALVVHRRISSIISQSVPRKGTDPYGQNPHITQPALPQFIQRLSTPQPPHGIVFYIYYR